MSLVKSMFRIGIAMALFAGPPGAGPVASAQSKPAQPAKGMSPGNGPDAWDANHDGVYTCDEWKAHLDRMFAYADRNHDGHLDAKEFPAIRQLDATLADAEFGYFDENQDGKISRSEFVGKPSEFILSNDKNGDCKVTPEELKGTNAPKSQQAPADKPRDRFH